jgi:serine/threonine-protein phosphatase 2A regulatory subunit A
MQATPMDIEEDVDPNKMIVDPPSTNAASEEEEARQAIDMLRGDDVSGRVAAANRLEAVAAALGEERTRDVRSVIIILLNFISCVCLFMHFWLVSFLRQELLPFLTDGVDDEDEVLVAIAANLGKLIEHVGGPAHAHTLLPCLELLLTVGE